MYRLGDDPHTVNNLAEDLAHQDQLEKLRYQMMTMLKEEKDPRALGNGAIFDTYKYVGGRQKGYETWLKKQDPPTDPPTDGSTEPAAPAKGKPRGKPVQ